MEFLHSRLIRRDGRAFDANADPFDCFGGIDRNLIAGLVTLRDAEVVVK